MPLRKHKASIKFVKGVQQKVDHKVIPIDSLVTLENGRFDKIGAVNKRTGYSLIDKEASDLIGYKNTLVARNIATGDKASAGTANRGTCYSESSGNFIGDFTSGNKGYSEGLDYTSIPVSRGSEYQQRDSNVAISSDGKYACITFVDVQWVSTDQSINYVKRCSIVDRETNTLLVSDLKLGAATFSGQNGRRMIPLWVASKFYIFGEDEGAIKFWIVDPTGATIVVKNAAGSASDAGDELIATANYPLTVAAAGSAYTTAQASFDACNSATATKALLFSLYLTGGVYTYRYYIFDTASHGITLKITSATVTGTTSAVGHALIYKPGISGTHANKIAFGFQDGSTYHIGVAATEAATSFTTYGGNPTQTFSTGTSATVVRGVFRDDINSITGNANEDVALVYEESSVTQIHGVSGNSALYITADVFATIPGTPELQLAYKQRLNFVFGRSPFTMGTVHDDNAGGVSGFYYPSIPINTVALWDIQRSAAKGASANTEYYTWIRDTLPIAGFQPLEYQTDLFRTASYSGDTLALRGSAVAVPTASHIERYGLAATTALKTPLNSIVRLYDFRRVNEELVDTPAPSTAMLQDVMYVADKGLFQYDGNRFRSIGFADRPSFRMAYGSITGGVLESGEKYYYKIVYEWTDAQGNLHESEPSGSANMTATVKQNFGIDIVQNELPDFPAKELRAAIYRTQGNGSVYNHIVTVNMDRSAGLVSYNDNITDATAATGKFLYTDSGELANTPPPASARYVVAHRDRLFVIGKDDVIYFSKIVKDGFGVAFTEAFSIKTPNNISDPPTALGTMDGNLFIFTENNIYIVGGEGPDNLGSGGFYEVKRVPTTVGAIKGSPVRLTNDGLIFISKKGIKSKIYLLGRNMSIVYIGSAVEDALSPPGGTPYMIKDITVNPEQETVMFLLSQTSGTETGVKIITYHYELKQWSVDTLQDTYGAGAGGSFAWSGDKLYIGLLHHISNKNPRVYKEAGTFADNTTYIPTKVKTAWVQLAGIQSYQRVYSFHVLGESRDKHTLTVNVYYDYDTSSPGNSYTFTTSDAADAKLQFRGHLTKQKCQAIQFEVVDADNAGSTDDGYTITEIGLELGLKADGYKQNNAKLTSTSTVGSN
tara:strand:+ start:2923 stop:6267 length:3345 start_codon:yes stop_codon:yes gene_type:complete